MKRKRTSLPLNTVLKIDKDCHVPATLEREYVHDSIASLRKRRLKVLWIKATRTKHGRHYYIKLNRPVDAQTANDLQYLLGDDSKRVAWNQERINSGLPEWNKLFESIGRQFRTIYRNESCSSRRNRSQR